MAWQETALAREELYRQVWERPVLQVARSYGLSNVGLAKICRRLGVPLPRAGHWAKLPGNRPSAPPLPPLRPGQAERHVLRRPPPPGEGEDIGDDARELLAFENLPAALIEVPEQRSRLHPLIVQYEGLLRCSRGHLDGAFFAANRCLDVRARGAALLRGIRVMNALLLALARRRIEVEVTEPRPSITAARILGERVPFRIQELSDAVRPGPRPGAPRLPSGRLALRIAIPYGIGRRTSWSDTKTRRIEHRLNEFVRELIVTAAALRTARRARERAELARRLEEERRERERRRARALEALRSDLVSRAGDFRLAGDIRALASAIEASAQIRGDPALAAGDLPRWLAWARSEAERLHGRAFAVDLEGIRGMEGEG